MAWNETAHREAFPIFKHQPVIYLDHAATSQRPDCVLEAERAFYEKQNANPLRGLYELAVEATEAYEEARRTVRQWIHAALPEEIIFTRNATESLNLAAYSYGRHFLKEGDEIVVSILEHHSNLLPWQMAAEETGAKLVFLECEPDGSIPPERMEEAFSERTKLVAVTHVSNVLGSTLPVEEIVRRAHARSAVVVLEAAQSVAHMPVDVTKLDVDFMAFSGHKMMGPMGIGVLYGKKKWLDAMPPFLRGGEMIDSVSRTGAVFAPIPHKFEAGTVHAAGAVGLAAAIRFLQSVGWETIQEREHRLTAYALEEMKKIPGIRVLGSEKAENHCGILSFTVDGVHPHDVASILDADHIAVRAGHHCAQPLLDYLKVSSAARASLAFYNTEEEIRRFLECLKQIRRKMGYVE